MNAFFVRWFTRVVTLSAVTKETAAHEYIGATWADTELEFEVTGKTKFFLDGKPCDKSAIKRGQRLVVDGKPALTVKAYTQAFPRDPRPGGSLGPNI